MNRTADHSDQAHPMSPMSPVSPMAEHLAHLHALVDAFVAHGHDLRTLHEQYKAEQDEGMSDEQRREQLSAFVHAELEILAESQRIHQQIADCLRMAHER